MGMLEVCVNGVAGPVCTVTVDANNSISALKSAIQKQTGIPPRQQRLMNGKQPLAADEVVSAIVPDGVTLIKIDMKKALMEEMRQTGSAAEAKAKQIKLAMKTVELLTGPQKLLRNREVLNTPL